MGNVLKCIKTPDDPPIPNDVIEIILKEQTQAINEIIDLVSDSDDDITKEETLNNKQVQDEA